MTYKINQAPACPHCGVKMNKWRIPPDSTWVEEFHWVCFNDECSYYVKGWEWMLDKYQHRSSYRCRMNPRDGGVGPVPVWSSTALKDEILPDTDTDNGAGEEEDR